MFFLSSVVVARAKVESREEPGSKNALWEFALKLGRLRMLLPGLVVGILIGLLATAPLSWQSGAPLQTESASASIDVARLSPAELETLAVNVLSVLSDQKRLAAERGAVALKDSWDEPTDDLRQIRLGIKNARRLLPLAKKLMLEALQTSLKTSRLSKEKRLIASVHRVVLDPRLMDTAEVWEENLTIIHVGPEYATDLTSDDAAVLMLGHELTHVAARTGNLNQFIKNVTETARLAASIKPFDEQKEELACDFIGAQVLKSFIALHPTDESNTERFSRAFGYELPSERLAFAWQDFCASYNGDPGDEQHLSQDQTLRALVGLDPDLKALVPDDALSTRLCR